VLNSAAIDIDLVSLYKALGGGWQQNDPVMPNDRSKSETGAREDFTIPLTRHVQLSARQLGYDARRP
jgi:hypothetical protein